MAKIRALVVLTALGLTLSGCSGGSSDDAGAVEASASAEAAEIEASEDAQAEAEAEAEAKADAQAEARAKAAAEARQKAKDTAERTACATDLDPLLAELSGIDSRLDIGLTADEFSDYVGDASVAYDGLPLPTMSLDCTMGPGIQLENAINHYIKANSSWQACIEDYGCQVEGAVLTGMRDHWTDASKQIDSVRRMLATNRAYLRS